MATYASPTIIKWLLLMLNSINFIIGMFIWADGAIRVIGFKVPKSQQELDAEFYQDWSESVSSSSSELLSTNQNTQPIIWTDKFPFVTSGGTTILFGTLIMLVAALGSAGVNKQDASLLNTYGYMSVICAFGKLFIIGISALMPASKGDPIKMRLAFVGIVAGICVLELVLAMCGCQMAKLLKRGDAAEPKIAPLSERPL